MNVFVQATFGLLLKLVSKIWCHFVKNLQRYDTISAHVAKRALQFDSEKTSVYRNGFYYISFSHSRNIERVSLCLVLF